MPPPPQRCVIGVIVEERWGLPANLAASTGAGRASTPSRPFLRPGGGTASRGAALLADTRLSSRRGRSTDVFPMLAGKCWIASPRTTHPSGGDRLPQEPALLAVLVFDQVRAFLIRVQWDAWAGRIGPAAIVGHCAPMWHVAPVSHGLARGVCAAGADTRANTPPLAPWNSPAPFGCIGL